MDSLLHIGDSPVRRLSDANVIGMYCWDIRGRLLDVNEAFCRITAYSRQALLSGAINYADLSAPEYRRADLQAVAELKQTGSAMPYEKEFIRADGTRVPVIIGGTFFAGSQEQGIAFVVDLNRRRRAGDWPHEGHDRYRMAAEAANDAILILDEKGVITYANRSVEQTFGYQPEELLGCDLTMLAPEHLHGDNISFKQYLHAGQHQAGPEELEIAAVRKNGQHILLEVSLGKFQHGGKSYFTAIMRDIAERKKTLVMCTGQNRLLEMIALGAPVEDVLEKLILLIESQSPGMLGSALMLDADGIHIRHGAAPNLPISFVQAIDGEPIGPCAGSCGTAMFTRQPVIVSDILNDPLWANYREAAVRFGLRACWSTPILSSEGKVLGSFAMYYLEPRSPQPADLRLANLASHVAGIAIERQQKEDHIRHMAHHDALTGLPNRVLLEQSLNQAITHAERYHGMIALLFIDIDNFKRINDSLGHPVGDQLLQGIAWRLQHCLRKDDLIARTGGDEFVIVLSSLPHVEEAALVADKALKALGAPFDVDGQQLHVGGSIGISLYPSDGTDAAALMRAADAAMYFAKARGRGNFRFFTEDLNTVIQHRLALENQLREAVAHDDLTLQFQPQVDLQSERIFSAEALLRWHHAERGLVPPEEFISIAEETGLILPIGEWVLREACSQLARWRADGRTDMNISVNLSARQIFQPGLADLVGRILREFRLPANALDLEITETMLMQPTADNMTTLVRLSEMGIQLSVDDFGIGYSSLSYLKRFPIQALKIDRSFVSGIGTDQNDTAITNAIIGMAQGLRLKVVAEGVETAEQASFLKAAGCRSAQGYYYGRPLTSDAFAALLHG